MLEYAQLQNAIKVKSGAMLVDGQLTGGQSDMHVWRAGNMSS